MSDVNDRPRAYWLPGSNDWYILYVRHRDPEFGGSWHSEPLAGCLPPTADRPEWLVGTEPNQAVKTGWDRLDKAAATERLQGLLQKRFPALKLPDLPDSDVQRAKLRSMQSRQFLTDLYRRLVDASESLDSPIPGDLDRIGTLFAYICGAVLVGSHVELSRRRSPRFVENVESLLREHPEARPFFRFTQDEDDEDDEEDSWDLRSNRDDLAG